MNTFVKGHTWKGVSWSFTGIRKTGRKSSYIATELYFLACIIALIPFGFYRLGWNRVNLFFIYYKVMINFFRVIAFTG